MIGIILAGGDGTRLNPLTKLVNKHLLPIYDKPMIYYSLSVLLLAKIKKIILICKEEDISNYKKIFRDGSHLNIKIYYIVQPKPIGIPDAFNLSKSIVKKSKVCLILGDNFFYGQDFTIKLLSAKKSKKSTIFTHIVKSPESFGILEYSSKNIPKKIVEKPKFPKSNHAITGLYFYTNEVFDVVEKLKYSDRGELEITDVNNYFLKKSKLNVEHLGRGYNWLDLGSFENILIASQFVRITQKLQGVQIASIEEIAFRNGWISEKNLIKLIDIEEYKLIMKS